MAIALSGSLVITGSIFATQGITGSFSGSATSASYADTLQGLGSASFAPAATFNTVSQSYAASSASLSIRVTTNETNISTLTSASSSFATMSGSLSTRVTNLEVTSSTVSQSFASTSGSISGRVTLIEGQYATTGSNTFTGPQFISEASNAIGFASTASLYTNGGLRVSKDSFVSGTAYFNNVVVYGTSSIQYITSSQLNIGTNIITVNTDTPAVRFGGLAVFDSGSTQLTGSILWDSQNNHWIYSNPSGSSYNSAMLMNGPRNTGSLGTEQGTTNNALMKGQGGDHITSSQVIDDGTTVRIPGALQVTGSTILASTLTGTSAAFTGSVNVTGSLTVTTTGTELQVISTGVRIGNVITDVHPITGSVSISGSLTGTIANFVGAITSDMTDGGIIFTKTAGNSTGLFTNTFQVSGSGTKNDLNAYVYGGESFGIWTNAIKRLTVTGGGNVGIGTTSPDYVLTINANGSQTSFGMMTGYTNANARNWGIGTNVLAFGDFSINQSNALGGLPFGAGTSRLYISQAGNVGMGTTNPQAKLSMAVASSASNVHSLDISNGVNASFAVYLRTGITEINAGGDGNMTFSNSSERMRITSGGNVGIGASTAPVYLLEVSATGGSQRIRVGTLQNNDNTARFEAITSNGTTVANSAWLRVNDASGFTLGQSTYTKSGGDSGNFANLSSEVESPAITVQGNGDVLIGSGTTAEGPLDVYRSNSAGLGGHILLRNNGAAVGNETAVLFVDGGVGSTRAAISSTTEGAPYLGDIKFKTGAGTYASLTTRMIITGAGSVGIGTTSPSTLLEISATTTQAWYRANRASTGYEAGLQLATGGTSSWYTGLRSADGTSSYHFYSYTTSTSVAQITSGGNVIVNNTSDNGAKFQVKGQGATGDTFSVVVTDSNNATSFAVRNDKLINTPGVYGYAYASTANVFVQSDGYLGRNTSSLKYKKNIKDYTRGLADVLKLRAVLYESKNPSEADKKFTGFIAEEIDEIGLTEFVQYAEDGTPDALQYPHFVALLAKAIQEQQAQIEALKVEIEILKNK